MIDFREIIKAQCEDGSFSMFYRNGWGKHLIDYLEKKDSDCLDLTGFHYLDTETRVIQRVCVCPDGRIMIRLIPGSDVLRFATPEEIHNTYHQYNVIYIDASELLYLK